MRARQLIVAAGIAGALVCGVAGPADAQQPVTAGVGFQALHDADAGRTLPGWALQLHVPTLGRYGVSAEASGGSTRFGTPSGDTRLAIQAGLVGVRVSGPAASTARLRPFGELLLGVAHARVRAGPISANSSKPALQPAGGIEVPLTRRLGLRGAVFCRRIFSSPGANEAGGQLGLVVAIRP